MNESLFNLIINTSQDCVFWKDKDRRFIGANRAFLDYYGFKSLDDILGKTDEDMGWHSDPEPFKQDELRVLSGESTYKVQGKCEVNGVDRDIIASKVPIYEGDKIVGLVGSFLDITEVVNRSGVSENAQKLYTADDLRKYSFFDKILDEKPVEELLDPLTGIISRPYALAFAQQLVNNHTPFTYAIVDLDNFKTINDTYGHRMGDHILAGVSKYLAAHMGTKGIAGRFGGDELLMINLEDTEFEDKDRFFAGLYSGESAFRRKYEFEGNSITVTATIGAASYPQDADTFEDIFGLIDKTLYRGKSRGRNCYTIYDENVHKDLEIKKLAKRGIYKNMHELILKYESAGNTMDRIKSVMPILKDEYHLSEVYYVDDEGILYSANDDSVKEKVGKIGIPTNDDLYSFSSLSQIQSLIPGLYDALLKRGDEAVMLVRVCEADRIYGYLVCAEQHNHRIWQEDECGIIYFLARLLAADLRDIT